MQVHDNGIAKAMHCLLRALGVVVAVVMILPTTQAAAAAGKNAPSGSLAQWVTELRQHPDDDALRARIIVAARRRPPAIPEAARRLFIRGNTAMAGSLGAYGVQRAIRDYDQALLLAPWWGDAYRNLAKARELAKDYPGAIEALHRYLQTGPGKLPARRAQDRIYALEEQRDEARDLQHGAAAATVVSTATPAVTPPAVGPIPSPMATAVSAPPFVPGGAPRDIAPKTGTEFRDCPDCPKMVVVAPGYAMGKYLVTQKQWRDVMGNNPSFFLHCGDDCPVEQVSWDDIQQFLSKLNERTGRNYRLPTESQWETACHAGSRTAYCGSPEYGNVAWFAGNSGGHTHAVGQKQANALGLYDMNGNVWEWTDDCLEYDCGFRILRGGSWIYDPNFRHASRRIGIARSYRLNEYGFRVVRALP